MAFLTDRTLAPGVTSNDLIHIVITGDTSQNPAGSSYKATMGQVIDLINPTTLTGGTYDSLTGTITFYDDTGGSFNVTGLVTGYTNTAVTGLTYNNSNTFTILENDGTTHSASINVVTGMTFNGFLKTSGSTTSGLYSFAFGNNLTSSGDYSFSQGLNNTSSGNYSHSEGRGSTSSGLYSHAEGKGNDSSGSDSHAEGSNTISSGVSSHAEGDGTESFGASSHAEGQDTLAYGSFSHAEGSGTTTYGQYSHAEGLGTITNGDYQLTIGQFNSTASTQSAFIIGNGTSNTNRSNLVLATGNTFNIYGNLSVTGTTSSAIISATTYQNLPTDIRVTGGTYSNGTATFTNNTGGTFSVSGFSTPFTGNSSATCITDLYVTNVIGCSPLRIQPNSTDPVYISQSGGNVAIATTSLDGTAPEALVVSGSNSTSYNLIVGRASVNNYAQLNIVNKSAGLSSSADVVATNNTGTELVNFIDMGINGSNYAGGIIGVANDAYLYSTGRELYIGNATTGSTGNIRIFAGDPATNIDIFVSGSTGFVGIGTTTPTSRLDVNGTTKSSVISATTYQNLPTDVRVTGATYSNNTFTYTNNTGGTFNVLFNSVTGLTVNGNLTVTGLTQTKGITSTGGITFPQKTISSVYSATTDDFLIDVTGGTFTVYLPSAVGIQGRVIGVKNNGGGAVTVLPILGQNIDDKTFIILGETNTILLVSNGSNWVAISYNISTLNSSTGVFEYTGATIASTSTFYVSPIKAWVVDDASNPLFPQLYYVTYTGGTHTAIYLSSSTETWFYLTSGGTISQSNLPLTESQRRQNVFLGKLGHANKSSIVNVFNSPDSVSAPLSQLRDMFDPIGFINQGIYPSANTGLTFNTSAGYLHGLGINYTSDPTTPNNIFVSAKSPTTFQYRVQTGGTASNTTLIDPNNYDVGGVLTAVGGGSNSATNQRIFVLANGQIRVQYGQTVYTNLADAIAGIQTEVFNTFSNFATNGCLIGILSVQKGISVLTNSSTARFLLVSKFGETVGAAGGLSTTTLQQAYNNSVTPEITINSTLDGLSIKNGTGNADNVSNLLEGINASDVTTSIIRADGTISGSSLHVSGTTGYNQLIVKTTYTPSGTTDTNGVLGDISWDASYVYVKTGAGWKRSGLATW